jgi:glutamate transport system permease protein
MSGSAVLFDAPGPKARRLSRILSLVGIVAIAAGLAWVVMTLAAPRPTSGGLVLPGMFDGSRWDIFAEPIVWQSIGKATIATLQAAGIAAVGAVLLGIILSILRTAANPWVRVPTTVLIEFFRGMPVLLMMLFILLVFATGGPLWAVVSALIIYNGTLIGEALRAGIASLPRGQREAGLSLGLSPLRTRLLIEFPQAFRQMLPIIVAQLVVLLKDTSLGYIVGYPELLRQTTNYLANFYGNRYMFSLFFVALAIYLTINLLLSWFARWLSRRTSSAGRRVGTAGPAGAGGAPLGAGEDPLSATIALGGSAGGQGGSST